MVSPKGRIAAVLLTGLLALPPSAALAQCQHHSNPGQTGMSQMTQGQGRQMSSMTSSMSQTSSCSMGMQTSQMSMMQPSQPLWFALQQGQQLHLMQMQMIAMQQTRLSRVQQTPLLPPSDMLAPAPRLGQAQQKQYGGLLKQVQALDQRLTGLEQAAQRHELQPPQAGAMQNEMNALQAQVDALPKAPAAVVDQMSSLHRRTDDLLERITAKQADVIAALRNSR